MSDRPSPSHWGACSDCKTTGPFHRLIYMDSDGQPKESCGGWERGKYVSPALPEGSYVKVLDGIFCRPCLYLKTDGRRDKVGHTWCWLHPGCSDLERCAVIAAEEGRP